MIGKEDKYIMILRAICSAKGISNEDLYKILKDRESKYMLLLLLRKYKCEDINIENEDFSIQVRKHIKYNFRKAEEKLLVSREFRELYFEVDNIINKDIG